MGGFLDEVVEGIARLVGVVPGDLGDEHVRWEIYLRGMEFPAARELLLGAVGAESDDSLAASVVLRMIERVGEAERAEWVNLLRGDNREYAHRRALEISIFERILSGAIGSAEMVRQVDVWTDWLQLRIAESAASPEVLDILSQAGRTRRIRNVAKGRQR